MGEVGPINLSTLVLTPAVNLENLKEKTNVKETINPNATLIQNLANLLIHTSNSTVLAASQALKHVLATGEGKIALDLFAKNVSKILPLLTPFINALSSTTIDRNVISKSAYDASIDPQIDLEKFSISML